MQPEEKGHILEVSWMESVVCGAEGPVPCDAGDDACMYGSMQNWPVDAFNGLCHGHCLQEKTHHSCSSYSQWLAVADSLQRWGDHLV